MEFEVSGRNLLLTLAGSLVWSIVSGSPPPVVRPLIEILPTWARWPALIAALGIVGFLFILQHRLAERKSKKARDESEKH